MLLDFWTVTEPYGAVLAGYMVAQVAVPQIDSPRTFSWPAGVNRGAAIVVGITAFAPVNDLFAAHG
jgi:hypothetical protein